MTEPICAGTYGFTDESGNIVHLPVMFVKHDSGRIYSQRAKQRNDCTVRAVALVRECHYDVAYDLLAQAGRKCSRGFNFNKWAKSQSWLKWISFPAVKGQCRMNPATFSHWFPRGRFIARTAGHVFAIIDGVCYDTIAPRPDRCIYGVWEVIAQ